MNNLFTRFLLREEDAMPSMPSPKKDPKMKIPGADKTVPPPDEPPDLTQPSSSNGKMGGGGAPSPDMGGDPAAGDVTSSPGDPPLPDAAGGGGDMPPDPSGAGGEDPTADPAAGDVTSSPGDSDPSMGGVQSPQAQIEQDEKDVFSDLKPGQLVIQRAELRDKYKLLYNTIMETIEKINKISHTTYDDTMLDFIVKKLVGLKNNIKDAIIDTFATRTYLENKIELQRFIVTFNRLSNMLSEIYKSRVKRNEVILRQNNTKNRVKRNLDFPVFSRGFDVQ